MGAPPAADTNTTTDAPPVEAVSAGSQSGDNKSTGIGVQIIADPTPSRHGWLQRQRLLLLEASSSNGNTSGPGTMCPCWLHLQRSRPQRPSIQPRPRHRRRFRFRRPLWRLRPPHPKSSRNRASRSKWNADACHDRNRSDAEDRQDPMPPLHRRRTRPIPRKNRQARRKRA